MPEYPLPEVPADLVKACLDDECVLYAGSGLSAQVGFETWIPFLAGLLDWAKKGALIDRSFASSLEEAMQEGDYNSVADSIVRAVSSDREALSNYLRSLFYRKTIELPKTHQVLKQIPFAALLTTNFDNLLELTFDKSSDEVLTPSDADRLLSELSNKKFFLLKLYGKIETPDTLLLSPAQYLQASQENVLFSQFMENLFFSRTILFVGASLEGISDYLSAIKFRGTTPPRRHFCLIDVKGTAWRAKANILESRYNIQVLPFTASEDYGEVGQFLEELHRQVIVSKQGTEPVVANRFPVTYLKRVQLENIGPFQKQSFDLTPGWNILFGDNGVGKSSLLKAIAVGLCGEGAKAYADRLIKTKMASGTENSSGTITIDAVTDTNGEKKEKTFVMKVFRSDIGGVISSHPPRPLETEGWLALGFPPMRIISWRREATDKSSVTDRPTPSDLLPLVAGESDPRLDNLKSWLIELDNQINRDLKNKITDSPSLKLREDFFTVIRALTPNVEIEFGSIGDKGKTVFVKTADGEVPIEAVSQGTTSLMGWVGVLLRRLFDLYGKTERPRDQHALVLIDEIDAHMHPEWQRQLIPKIRELFPNIQVIATTHSPLLVPSLKRNEMIRLRRKPGVPGIIVEVPQYDFQNLRANQILTSPLFELESSLSPAVAEITARYTELMAKDQRTESEQTELERLALQLNINLPSPKEETAARVAYNMIQLAMAEKLVKIPTDMRAKIDNEIKVQLQEFFSGSGRT